MKKSFFRFECSGTLQGCPRVELRVRNRLQTILRLESNYIGQKMHPQYINDYIETLKSHSFDATLTLSQPLSKPLTHESPRV